MCTDSAAEQAASRRAQKQVDEAAWQQVLKNLTREDIEALAEELQQLRAAVRAERSAADFAHLRKLERWGRLCSAFGFGTAWIAPNPISAGLIALGKTTRWTCITHPISHGGYEGTPDIPKRYTRKHFAKGWRRYIDWFDWIAPEAWHHEHDVMHHFRLGETADPDQMEENFAWLRDSQIPMPLRYAITFVLIASWKFVYYAPTTLMELQSERRRRNKQPPFPRTIATAEQWDPRTERGRELWTRCLLPYLGHHFVALPMLFLPLGPIAATNVLINSLLGELFHNLHSFLVIGPNHTGEDLVRFEDRPRGRAEFFLHQILGSVNFTTGGDLNDWLHGWLNYQIEHHLFPNLTLREYQKIQPGVKALCEKYGVPYRQESVLTRAKKTLAVMVGKATMRKVTRLEPKPDRRTDAGRRQQVFQAQALQR